MSLATCTPWRTGRAPLRFTVHALLFTLHSLLRGILFQVSPGDTATFSTLSVIRPPYIP
ncbi:MAG: hypothetical protein KDE09_10620 [Anaerolineales bacterium]|nr:hypothetical protein [Anaerolineales bacterium]